MQCGHDTCEAQRRLRQLTEEFSSAKGNRVSDITMYVVLLAGGHHDRR
jgi:hypothetical protein